MINYKNLFHFLESYSFLASLERNRIGIAREEFKRFLSISTDEMICYFKCNSTGVDNSRQIGTDMTRIVELSSKSAPNNNHAERCVIRRE